MGSNSKTYRLYRRILSECCLKLLRGDGCNPALTSRVFVVGLLHITVSFDPNRTLILFLSTYCMSQQPEVSQSLQRS